MSGRLTSGVIALCCASGCFGSIEDAGSKMNIARFTSPCRAPVTVTTGEVTLTLSTGTAVGGEGSNSVMVSIDTGTNNLPTISGRKPMGSSVIVGPATATFSTPGVLNRLTPMPSAGQQIVFEVDEISGATPTVVCPPQLLTTGFPSCSQITEAGQYAFYQVDCYANASWDDDPRGVAATCAILPECSSDTPLFTSFLVDPSLIAWVEPLGTPSSEPSATLNPYEGWMRFHPTDAWASGSPSNINAPGKMVATGLTLSPTTNKWTLWLRGCQEVGIGISGIVPSYDVTVALEGASAAGYAEIPDGLNLGTLSGTEPFEIEIQDGRLKPAAFVAETTPFATGTAYAACPIDPQYVGPAAASALAAKVHVAVDGQQGPAPIAGGACGTLSWDVPGTAQGYWYAAGHPETRLALVPSEGSTTVEEILAPSASGGVGFVPTLAPVVHAVTIITDSTQPMVNQPFAEIRPSATPAVYCFQGLTDASGSGEDEIVLISLKDVSTLIVEAQHQATCMGATFTGNGVTFVRNP